MPGYGWMVTRKILSLNRAEQKLTGRARNLPPVATSRMRETFGAPKIKTNILRLAKRYLWCTSKHLK